MPVIHDPMQVPGRTSTIYPAPFNEGFEGRIKRALTQPLGLTQFGVNLTTLEPGGGPPLRHCHAKEDAFIYVLSGELVLLTKQGETLLRPVGAVGFPAGDESGHQLINRGSVAAIYLEIGTRSPDEDATYPDVDLKAVKRGGVYRFFHKNGEPYE